MRYTDYIDASDTEAEGARAIMSAQLYLSRLVDEGRSDRALHRSSLRTSGLARLERRLRRAREDRKH